MRTTPRVRIFRGDDSRRPRRGRIRVRQFGLVRGPQKTIWHPAAGPRLALDGGTATKKSPSHGRYQGRSKWYPGAVRRAHDDGTLDIDYDDGEHERRVDEKHVRPLDDEPGGFKKKKLKEGDKVEARYKGRAKWYPRPSGDSCF